MKTEQLLKNYVVVLVPDPFQEMGREETSQRPNSLITPQGLE